jgi:hypothetical protein
MTEEQRDEAIDRIAQIDRMFEDATGWGSWMIMSANEREDLVDQLRAGGVMIGLLFAGQKARRDDRR